MSGKKLQSWSRSLFVLPSVLHHVVFVLFPIVFAFYLSLHRWDVLKADKPFVGLDNYVRVIQNPYFWNALAHSAYFAGVSVPLGMVVALLVALLVYQQLRLTSLFRIIYYLPAVSSAVAISMIWTFVYLPEQGLLNWTLGKLGLAAFQTDWLQSPVWAMPALIFMSIWMGLGPRMVLFLAGLSAIPQSLYEAAEVDGAGTWGRFRHITLPLLLPTTFFILVTSTIGALQVFTPIYMMTRGGPVRATDVVGYHIYNQAWRQFQMGTASAQSYILFVIILMITFVQFRFVRKRMEEYTLSS